MFCLVKQDFHQIQNELLTLDHHYYFVNNRNNTLIKLCAPKLSGSYFILCMLTWVAAPSSLLIFALCQDEEWKNCCEYFEFCLWAIFGFIPSVLFVYIILPFSAIYYGIIGLKNTENESFPKIKIATCIGSITIKNKWIPFLKLFEQIGEALPQFIIALAFYVNHKDYINAYDTVFGSSVPITLVSIIFSGISVLIGVLTGLKTFKHMYDEGEGMFKKE